MAAETNNNEQISLNVDPDQATQKPSFRRPSSTDTERPPSTQLVNRDANDKPTSEAMELDQEQDDADSDPAEEIADFDWDDLRNRYHAKIKECETNEDELMQEFESLMNYFKIWAGSGHAHETGRTFARLNTRMAYVQNSEAMLEQRRIHYVNVVKAFESAMELLTNGFR
ncbi:hypothetical protein K504DRAFT_388632 [Pleomassaria siparia CBS 279.74]|uniref:Uncharacterized protein n=1 Tax=Pleomassaria siparia CBS 279.74 TaxID=1314801 RepID=A0A6G1JY38_9PLEO|nr:hypothetical protein K504DRAFT_388632 [Pleomassaria siparia CBS 279.74]